MTPEEFIRQGQRIAVRELKLKQLRWLGFLIGLTSAGVAMRFGLWSWQYSVTLLGYLSTLCARSWLEHQADRHLYRLKSRLFDEADALPEPVRSQVLAQMRAYEREKREAQS